MTDHLKDIWNRFEEKTTRNLTGAGVDNIPRPVIEEMERHRSRLQDAHEAVAVPMPEGVPAPADAAFSALRDRLTSFDKKGRPSQQASQDFSVPQINDDQLTRDLKETEKLTARKEPDYLSSVHRMEAENGRPKRKKFLGIF
ncbi:hypothetical protein [Parvularcula sp. IMCC14364]|uniref:hypothetical protein n=1 Tax=Parvularcula sp. IMCC14364 TaxID=3067902 RepID=UPI0027406967|nr:hypothetical protein [Parvularcula sp. IMCC14364]